jgi:hypothetical protein
MEMIVIEIDLSQIPSDKIKNFLRKNGNEANVVSYVHVNVNSQTLTEVTLQFT